MPSCIIKGCTTKQVKGQRTGEIIMHSFPGNPTRVRRWLESTGQHFDNLEELIDKIVATKKTSNYRICSLHFSPACYEIIGSRKVLNKSALPTICPQALQEQAQQSGNTAEPVPQTSLSDDESGSNLDKQVAKSKEEHNYAYIIKPYEKVPFVYGVPDDEQDAPQVLETAVPMSSKSILSQSTGVTSPHSAKQTSKPHTKRAASKRRNSSTTTRGLIKCKDASTSTGSYEEFLAEIEKYQKIFSRMEEFKRSYITDKMQNQAGPSTQGYWHRSSEDGVLSSNAKKLSDVCHKTDIVYAAAEVSDVSDHIREPSYHREENASSDDALEEPDEYEEENHVRERKFLVFESCLNKLLTLVRCQHEAGCPAAVKEYFRILRVPFLSALTYALYQRKYCFPAIDHSWLNEKRSVRESLAGRPVCLTGDGHCDRHGFSAKYCTYTFMDEKSKKIVDFSVTRVSERTSSVAMERKAFRRTLNNILNDGIKVIFIVTDRHPSIAKIMQEEYRDIKHQFDVRHYAKTLNKKLCALARKRNNKALGPWILPIIRYFWFITEYCKGNVFLLKELWNSTVHHVSNCHSWVSGEYVKKCLHADLSEEEVNQRPWIQRHSNALSDLSLLVHDKRIQNDLHHLKEFYHKVGNGDFHSLVLKYRPKGTNFKMDAMVARTTLAVLAHNHNVDRPHVPIKHATSHMDHVDSQTYRPYSKMAAWNVEYTNEVSSTDHINPILDQIIGHISRETKHTGESRSAMLPPNIAWNSGPETSATIWRPSSPFKRIRLIDELGRTSYLSPHKNASL
uniref:THAP-type domain-containing protein n=1 Tax=Leptobrachium leishanense TaxID=445787 RepID=A0A8C5MAL9_9ANUR